MQHFISCRRCFGKNQFESRNKRKKWHLYITLLHFIKSRFQHCWMLNIEFWRIFLEISSIMVSGGSYRRMCWWKRAIQYSKWIWASFCILFHTFRCTGAKIRWYSVANRILDDPRTVLGRWSTVKKFSKIRAFKRMLFRLFTS